MGTQTPHLPGATPPPLTWDSERFPVPRPQSCKLTFIKCSPWAEFEPLLDSTSSASPGPRFRPNHPNPPPPKKGGESGRSIPRSQARLLFQFLLLPSADQSTGSKPSFGPRERASCLAQAQDPKQVAAAGDPALGGGLLRTLARKARRPRQPSPTYGVQRSLYSLAIVSMPPARATAT